MYFYQSMKTPSRYVGYLVANLGKCICGGLLICTFPCFAQSASFAKCNPFNWTYYYFAFDAKYEVASETLVAAANQRLGKPKIKTNGFVTICFVVNCKGEKGNFEVLQIDDKYQAANFDKTLTDQLLEYTKPLTIWQLGYLQDDKVKETPFDYYGFITFKLNDGKITEIIP